MVMKKNKDGSITSHVKAKGDVIPVRLNEQDRIIIELAKELLEQPKDSTVLKQLAYLGYFAIQDQKTNNLLRVIFKNKKNNKRNNIIEFD